MFIVTNAHILILITGIISSLYLSLEILLVLLKQFSNYKYNVPIDSFLERFQILILFFILLDIVLQTIMHFLTTIIPSSLLRLIFEIGLSSLIFLSFDVWASRAFIGSKLQKDPRNQVYNILKHSLFWVFLLCVIVYFAAVIAIEYVMENLTETIMALILSFYSVAYFVNLFLIIYGLLVTLVFLYYGDMSYYQTRLIFTREQWVLPIVFLLKITYFILLPLSTGGAIRLHFGIPFVNNYEPTAHTFLWFFFFIILPNLLVAVSFRNIVNEENSSRKILSGADSGRPKEDDADVITVVTTKTKANFTGADQNAADEREDQSLAGLTTDEEGGMSEYDIEQGVTVYGSIHEGNTRKYLQQPQQQQQQIASSVEREKLSLLSRKKNSNYRRSESQNNPEDQTSSVEPGAIGAGGNNGDILVDIGNVKKSLTFDPVVEVVDDLNSQMSWHDFEKLK